jgi:hypothetical protein
MIVSNAGPTLSPDDSPVTITSDSGTLAAGCRYYHELFDGAGTARTL